METRTFDEVLINRGGCTARNAVYVYTKIIGIVILAVRISLCVIGTILLGLGLFVYEDEEKALQSHLEDFWVRLDDKRLQSLAIEQSALARIAKLVSALLDWLFGDRLFSMRVMVVSTAISILCAALMADLIFLRDKSSRPDSSIMITIQLSAIWCVAIVALARKRFAISLGLWTAAAAAFVISTWSSDFTSMEEHGWALLGIGLGVLTDVLLIALTRRSVRSLAMSYSVLRLVVVAVLSLPVAFAIWFGPLVLQYGDSDFAWMFGPSNQQYVGYYLFIFNSSDALVFVATFCVSSVLVCAHAVWPIAQRPLYAIQRTGITSNKKASCSAGVVIVSAGLAIKNPLTTQVLEAIKKVLSG